MNESAKRMAAFRFKSASDVDLLKEVIHIQPYDAPYGAVKSRWDEVAANMCMMYGDGLTSVSCRKRFDDLLDAFKRNTISSLRASGTEEEYNEREQLLQDIVDLVGAEHVIESLMVTNTQIDQSHSRKRMLKEEKQAKVEKRECDGERLRDAAMRAHAEKKKAIHEPSGRDAESEDSKEKKPRKVQKVTETGRALDSFALHFERANEIKTSEIQSALQANALAQRRLELEEARFALDKAEREARLELDKRDRENQWKLIQGTLEVLRSFVPKQ
ncbi:hypothetical protein DYB32_010908 [Aphanomyces invadans]|uniref:Myb-like domain-containing protein n=1 Tax=Aphanomyces invadans TaxID=157072 RepID=A0A3R6V1Z8_9STRA|nr:hypothetical protein DYB32_010908 [Aphanomyces invadans]